MLIACSCTMHSVCVSEEMDSQTSIIKIIINNNTRMVPLMQQYRTTAGNSVRVIHVRHHMYIRGYLSKSINNYDWLIFKPYFVVKVEVPIANGALSSE